jgi:hypothetical protein
MAIISGTPTAQGTSSFTIRATDNLGFHGDQAYSVTINPTLSITTTTLPYPDPTTTYLQTISATGGDGNYTFSQTAGTLPTGLTLTSVGVLYGTATVQNSFTFTVTVTDGVGGTADQPFTLVVTAPITPAAVPPLGFLLSRGSYGVKNVLIITPSIPPGQQNAPYSASIQAVGGAGGHTFSTSDSLPTGIHLDSPGVLGGTPTVSGTFNFSIVATDRKGATGSRPFSLVLTPTATTSGILSGTPIVAGTYVFTIRATDITSLHGDRTYTVVIAAPVMITTTSLPNGTISTSYSQTIATSGGTAPLTFSTIAGTIPTGLTLNSSTGVLAGTPTGTADSYSFTVRVVDAVTGTATQGFSIVIGIRINPGTLPGGTISVSYDQTLTSTGGVGSVTYAVTAGTLPTGLTLDTGGVLSGTPTTTLGSPFSFTVTGTDSALHTGSRAYTVAISSSSAQLLDATADFSMGATVYTIPGNFGSSGATCNGLAHRYVGGQLRFLTGIFNANFFDIIEFTLPTSGTTVSTITNRWASKDVFPKASSSAGPGLYSGGYLGEHFTMWHEDSTSNPGYSGPARLWTANGISYVGAQYGDALLAESISVRELDTSGTGTVSNPGGLWGFQDPTTGHPYGPSISQRCLVGKIQPVPSWAQSLYGFHPYMYIGGGNFSIISGGVTSSGLFVIASRDVSDGTYTAPATYPPAGYNNDGTDWSIPSSEVQLLADFRVGAGATVYDANHDRGRRLTAVVNYYDGDQQPPNYFGNSSATWTHGSTTVTFSSNHTIADGDWIGPFNGDGEKAVIGQLGYVVSGATTNSNTCTVNNPWQASTFTDTNFVLMHNPPAPPAAGSQWVGTAPDGNYWWCNDSYFETPVFIDGPTKHGLVCIFSGSTGKSWYHKPGNFNASDGSVSELHVFDPADLGSVLAGTKKPWNVQPSSMRDLSPELNPIGICTLSFGAPNEVNCAAFTTYDSTTKRLWVLCPVIDYSNGANGPFGNASTDSRLIYFDVNA